MKAFNNRLVHANSKALTAWRDQIAEAFRNHHIVTHPIGLDLTFIVKQPATVRRPLPSVRPDLDKYVRAVMDALTKVVYVDDGQVCDILARKRYGHTPGVIVNVYPIH